MDVSNITIGQAREIAAMFTQNATTNTNPMIGKYVVVRCKDAGVHAGVLESTDGRACILISARRLWFWKVNGCGDFLNAIALAGVHKDSKLSAPVERIQLTENCEILQCSDEAERVIRAQEVYNG